MGVLAPGRGLYSREEQSAGHLARVKVGDQLTVTIHEGGTIVLTPVRPALNSNKAAVTAKRFDPQELRPLQAALQSEPLAHLTAASVERHQPPACGTQSETLSGKTGAKNPRAVKLL